LATALLNLGEREEEGEKQDGPGSRVKFVKSTKDMETKTDQGSEIQEEMGQTRIPMDHMDTRTKQYQYQDLGFREEEWPAIGQGKEEEGDYVYQP
jgi:hypothetical protein